MLLERSTMMSWFTNPSYSQSVLFYLSGAFSLVNCLHFFESLIPGFPAHCSFSDFSADFPSLSWVFPHLKMLRFYLSSLLMSYHVFTGDFSSLRVSSGIHICIQSCNYNPDLPRSSIITACLLYFLISMIYF